MISIMISVCVYTIECEWCEKNKSENNMNNFHARSNREKPAVWFTEYAFDQAKIRMKTKHTRTYVCVAANTCTRIGVI